MMGYVTMPSLQETLPIYHGTSEKVLQSGIGHWNRPHCQLAARPLMRRCLATGGCPRQTVHGLEPYEKGDKFYITILKDTYAYQVDKITTVLPTDAKQLAIEPGKDLVTHYLHTVCGQHASAAGARSSYSIHTTAAE